MKKKLFILCFFLPALSFAQDDLEVSFLSDLWEGAKKSFQKEGFKATYDRAKKGSVVDQYRVGIKYYEGSGVERDIGLAIHWLKMAAENDHRDAQSTLGFLYFNIQNYVDSGFWLYKAADSGDEKAQYGYSILLLEGLGRVKDFEAGFQWMEKSAEQGYIEAQYLFGKMHFDGMGTSVNFREAAKWFRKAAKRNSGKAQYALGLLYFEGKGVIQEYKEAYAWVNVAISLHGESVGDDFFHDAVATREVIAASMDESSLIEAQTYSKQVLKQF